MMAMETAMVVVLAELEGLLAEMVKPAAAVALSTAALVVPASLVAWA